MKDLLELFMEWISMDVCVAHMDAGERSGAGQDTHDWTDELMSRQWEIWHELPDEIKEKIESFLS